MNVEELKKKKHVEIKSHSVLEGLKGGPLKHTKTFFLPFFFVVNIHKKCILYQFKTFSQKYAGNKKKKEIIDRKVFKL